MRRLVRRLALALFLCAGFAFAFGLSAVPGSADDGTPPPTTTAVPTDTTPTTTTEPAASVLPPGVTIEGVPVGGLTSTAAFLALQSSFDEPLHLVVPDGLGAATRLAPTRTQLGAVVYVWGAISRAKSVAPGSAVDAVVAVNGKTLRQYLAGLAKRYDRSPVDAKLRLDKLAPKLTKERPGTRLELGAAASAIVKALETGSQRPLTLPVKVLKPAVTRASFGPVIVVRRGDNRLRLYNGTKTWRTFKVATGQSVYPTPLGRYEIVVKWKNPWWYPPASPWAAGEKPVPPGPGNPLGTRWMGISSPGVGIHGTPDASSLGYSASHGCIRMAIPEAEWLFDHVDVGTPVYVVAA